MEENLMTKMQELLSDPESMQQISELAQMFQNGGIGGGEPPQAGASQCTAGDAKAGEVSALPDSGGFDAGMLLKMGELMQHTNHSDKNTALLLALKPHLGEQRQQKVDKALRLMKLWVVFQTMKKTGMLQQLL